DAGPLVSHGGREIRRLFTMFWSLFRAVFWVCDLSLVAPDRRDRTYSSNLAVSFVNSNWDRLVIGSFWDLGKHVHLEVHDGTHTRCRVRNIHRSRCCRDHAKFIGPLSN